MTSEDEEYTPPASDLAPRQSIHFTFDFAYGGKGIALDRSKDVRLNTA
jgi:hypothetical protein